MNERSIASLLGDLIEANEEERASMEKLLSRYGVNGFFKRLHEGMPLSMESLEKLRAVRVMIEQLPARNITELKEETKYGSPPHE